MKRGWFLNTIFIKVFLIVLTLPCLGYADTSQFFYDPLGRLSAIVNEQGEGITYQYDAVGNLLSVTPLGPPTISAVDPQVLDAGVATLITMTGTGLTIDTVSSSNPDLQINLISTSVTSLKAELIIANPTVFGLTPLTVTSSKGSETLNITVRQPLPTIIELSTDIGTGGVTLEILGTGFGTKTNSNLVTFAGLGGVRLPANVLNGSFTKLTVEVPVGVISGSITIEVAGVTSNNFPFRALSLLQILSTTIQGIPLDPAKPSANQLPGQTIQLVGSEFFGVGLQVTFSVIGNDGMFGFQTVLPATISPDGTTATVTAVTMPNNIITGPVTLTSAAFGGQTAPILLQIVPQLHSFSLSVGESFIPDALLSLSGASFKEGETTINFTGVSTPVAPADVTNIQNLTVVIPAGAIAGSISVNTDGGISETIPVYSPVITNIISTANLGVPADPTQPSANIGDVITLIGSEFSNATSVFFMASDDNGLIFPTFGTVLGVAPDGQSLTVFFDNLTVSGPVTVQDQNSRLGNGGVNLQIVPDLFSFNIPAGEDFSPGTVITLTGRGFQEGSTVVNFTGASAPVAALDVFQNNERLAVTIPPNTTGGALSVTTDGGTSEMSPVPSPMITGIISTASSGTPVDINQPSANINQIVTLEGNEFDFQTRISFTGFDASGLPISLLISPNTIAPDKRSLTVSVPQGVISGSVTVQDLITGLGTGNVNLQIVPTLNTVNGSLTAGSIFQIQGNGFDPTTTQVLFPGVIQPAGADTTSILQSLGTESTVTVPVGVSSSGQLTMITAGGTSNAINLGGPEIEPNDTPATATLLPLNVSKTGTMDPVGDQDYFQVDLLAGQTYFFAWTAGNVALGVLGIEMTWLAQDGVTVLSSFTMGAVSGQTVGIPNIIPAVSGIYFIRVREITGRGGPDISYTAIIKIAATFTIISEEENGASSILSPRNKTIYHNVVYAIVSTI